MIVAVVLAAGQSSRMGRAKQTLRLKGKPMLQRALDIYARTKVDRVVVVLGAGAGDILRSVRFGKAEVVINEDYRLGMSGSLKLGIYAAGPRAEAVIVALGDQPYVSPTTVDRLIDSYRKRRPRAVIPVYMGVRGNPILLDRALFPEIEEITGDVGAKAVIARKEDSVLEVPVLDKGVVTDIDTPGDLKGPAPGGRTPGQTLPRKKKGSSRS